MKRFADKHKDTGLKLTPQRLAIMKIMEESKDHPSVEEVFKRVRKTFPTTSFKTVYATLDLMQQRGMIREVNIDPCRKRYCPNPALHHHLICTSCKGIVDVFEEIPISLKKESLQGYILKDTSLSIQGICPRCASEDTSL